MKDITIICDRCGLMVKGKITTCATTGAVVTSGYYNVAEGNWEDFGRWDEVYVCDTCMHACPKYKKTFLRQ